MRFTFGLALPQCAASLKGNEPWPQERVPLLHHCLAPCCHPAEAHTTFNLQSINKGRHQQNRDHIMWGQRMPVTTQSLQDKMTSPQQSGFLG